MYVSVYVWEVEPAGYTMTEPFICVGIAPSFITHSYWQQSRVLILKGIVASAKPSKATG